MIDMEFPATFGGSYLLKGPQQAPRKWGGIFNADAAIFVLDYAVRDEHLAYVLDQKAIRRQLKQVAFVGLPEPGTSRFQFHWDNAAIDSNQIVGPAAQSVPCRNETMAAGR